MRTFAIVLGCLAWVLSCFDAVSYYRAGTQQLTVEARLKAATTSVASAQVSAGRDSAHLSVRLLQDQAAIDSDQAALTRNSEHNLGNAQDRQTLAADQAALQADRMMQYTVESFAQTDPNPEVTAALNRVDLDQRSLNDLLATRERDLKLSHALIALWALVVGTAFIAFRSQWGFGAVEEVSEEEEAEPDADRED